MPDQPRELEIQEDDGVTWTVKKISRLFADGRVFLLNVDEIGGEWYDLVEVKYRYVL